MEVVEKNRKAKMVLRYYKIFHQKSKRRRFTAFLTANGTNRPYMLVDKNVFPGILVLNPPALIFLLPI